MEEEKNLSTYFFKGLFKSILWLLLSFFFLLTIMLAAFQFPFFQTKLVSYLSKELSEKLEHKITIDYVNIDWFDQVSLHGLKVKENNGRQILFAKKLWIDFDIRYPFVGDQITVDRVEVDSLSLNMHRDIGEPFFNLDILVSNIRNIRFKERDKSKIYTPKPFIVKEISLTNSSYGIFNWNGYALQEGFDYHRFSLKEINAELQDFYVLRDSIYMDINKLTAYDSLTKLSIHQLASKLSITSHDITLAELDASIGKTKLSHFLKFKFKSYADFQDFNNLIALEAVFENSIIHSKDIELFAPELKPFNETVGVSGNFNGFISDFTLTNSELSFGNNSAIKGQVSLDGLPNVNETFIYLTLQTAEIWAEDLRQYIKDSLIYSQAVKLGKVDFTGQFTGFTTDFVANGIFNTALGRVESDLNLKLDGIENSQYRGSISAFNFDIGQLLDSDSLFQKIQVTGTVNGKGLSKESVDAEVDVKVGFIGINNYNYQNISTKARLAFELFEGHASINDPNFKFEADAKIDLRNNINSVSLIAKLDTIPLHLINITENEAFVKLNINADFVGLHPDSIQGTIYVNDFYGYLNNEKIQIDTIALSSVTEEKYRKINIDTELLSAQMEGDFVPSFIIKNLIDLAFEFAYNLDNDATQLKTYYEDKNFSSTDSIAHFMTYSINVKDIDPILNIFVPELEVSKNISVSGSYLGGGLPVFTLSSAIDTLAFRRSIFIENRIDFSISKLMDTTTMMSALYFYSESQLFGERTKTNNLEADAIWNAKKLDFTVHIDQEGLGNFADIGGFAQFDSAGVSVQIYPSNLVAINRTFNFHENNQILIHNKEIEFKNFGISHEEQFLTFNGFISELADKKLEIAIDEVNVSNLNPLIEKNYFGLINGKISVLDFYNQRIIESDVKINEFKIDEFLVGDIVGYSNWLNTEDKLDMNYSINRLGKDIISFKGWFTPNSETDQLDIKAQFNDANLNIAEPFIDDIFSRLSGTLTGDFSIKGMLNYPILTGTGQVSSGEIRVNYLNTLYSVNGNVRFTQDEILFDRMRLLDAANNEGFLYGSITHKGFSEIYLDLGIDANRFRVLNTTARDNDYFYGTANVSGQAKIIGSTKNITIEANLRSERGTRFSIPVEYTSSVEQEDFIHFIDPSDTTRLGAAIEEIGKVDLTGINLKLDLDITPDAYTEIIFDLRAGDIIRGRGNGKLALQIDTNGEFLMFGDYEFTEGGYNFTLYDIVNKEFVIDPGSKISWYGDPYEGQLDIKAKYEQYVSIVPLLVNADTTITNESVLRRRYPSTVILKLKDNLLAPEIDFEIELSGYPESVSGYPVGGEIQAFKTEIMADEQELNRQVFSLIMMRRFMRRASFVDVIGQGGSIGNSVSELLSNQLSNWLSQVDDNFEIELDLGSMDQDALNTFQLRMSYSFMEGRLRVSRDGGLTSQVAAATPETEMMGIIGDWTVEYLLSNDGKLRVRMYNRTNVNPYTAAVGGGGAGFSNQTTTSAGFSLMHIESFNTLKDLFKSKNKKEKNYMREPEEVKPKDYESEEPTDSEKEDLTAKNK